jgi:hypothetical protein
MLRRYQLIGRAKIVLNLHAYATEVFEIVRVSYLLANAKAVVAETSPDLGSLADAVAAYPYDEPVKGCIALLENVAERRALEARGFRIFSTRSQARILHGIVGAATQAPQLPPSSSAPTVPGLRKLYLDMVQRCVINTIYEEPKPRSLVAAHLRRKTARSRPRLVRAGA